LNLKILLAIVDSELPHRQLKINKDFLVDLAASELPHRQLKIKIIASMFIISTQTAA
jgi:hypothetical protein